MKKLSLIILTLLVLFACADDRVTQLETQIAALQAQLTELSTAETGEPVDNAAEIAALEEELAALEAELAELQQNSPPSVSISASTRTVDNGGGLSLTAEIIDEDDWNHDYTWSVDGVPESQAAAFSFSRAPEAQTDYIVSVTVSDGQAEAADSITLTVTDPPWRPEPLKIYIFEVGVPQCDETAIQIFETSTDQYRRMISAVRVDVENHNASTDPDWCYIGGGLP